MSTIDVPVSFTLLGRRPMPVRGRLVWTSDDPVAVTMVIGPNAPWKVARDLLADGLHGAAGVGDVHLSRHPVAHLVQIDLRSPDGRASLTLERQLLADFLQATWLAVPYIDEQAIVDEALTAFDWAGDRA